jgi:hypothetical protein
MDLIDAFKPKTFYETLIKSIRNYSNWRYYKKVMQRLLTNGSLKQNGMRMDLRHRAYYVLNLEPETLMMGQEVLELEKSRVYESLGKKKALFEDSGLAELIEATTERKKSDEYYGYLIQIKYRSMSTISDLLYIIVWAIGASIVTYFLIKLSLDYESIFVWFNNLMNAK